MFGAFVNYTLEPEDHLKIERMKNEDPEQFFTQEYIKNNEYIFKLHMKESYKIISKFSVENNGVYLLYKNEENNDVRISHEKYNYDYKYNNFFSIDEINDYLSKNKEEEASPKYLALNQIKNKYQELIEIINKKSKGLKI